MRDGPSRPHRPPLTGRGPARTATVVLGARYRTPGREHYARLRHVLVPLRRHGAGLSRAHRPGGLRRGSVVVGLRVGVLPPESGRRPSAAVRVRFDVSIGVGAAGSHAGQIAPFVRLISVRHRAAAVELERDAASPTGIEKVLASFSKWGCSTIMMLNLLYATVLYGVRP
jgi:hypothetical protein